jgi:opacity protein-like surface antigen
MRKTTFLAAAAIAVMSATTALAADMPVKVTKAPPMPVSPWDFAFGAAIMNDYNFRGITQSNHRASVAEYQELRYNWNSSLQSYLGLSGESISFPNRSAAEVDFYGGIRPTFGPVAFDFGVWYYYYPGGTCIGFSANNPAGCQESLPNGNTALKDPSFIEYYGKVLWTVNDSLALGANEFYDPDWLASGSWGNFAEGTIKYTLPSSVPLPSGVGAYLSGEVGHYWFGGTINPLLVVPTLGLKYPDYTTWNAGLGFTYKVFTLDLRYYDTDLSKKNCNYLTSDWTAGTDKLGLGESTWCGSSFVAKFSMDLSLGNLK